MKWIEVEIITTNYASEAISEKLMNIGASGTEIVDPIEFSQVLENNKYLDYADDKFIDQYGTDVIIRAYFSEDRNPSEISEILRFFLEEISTYLDIGRGEIKCSLRDDNEWKDVWKQYFKPFNLTDKIIIKPSWEEYTQKDDEIVIEMDPGMAFGTGTHETTRMCAIMGEKHINNGDRVLDLGCGTAVLGILASKLGASSVLAVDIDDAAVKAASQNVDINREYDKINVMCGVLSDIPKEPFDLVFINIIADVIMELSKEIKGYVKKDTIIILSGIIKDRKDDVKKAYLDLGFSLIDQLNMGEWEAIVFRA